MDEYGADGPPIKRQKVCDGTVSEFSHLAYDTMSGSNFKSKDGQSLPTQQIFHTSSYFTPRAQYNRSPSYEARNVRTLRSTEDSLTMQHNRQVFPILENKKPFSEGYLPNIRGGTDTPTSQRMNMSNFKPPRFPPKPYDGGCGNVPQMTSTLSFGSEIYMRKPPHGGSRIFAPQIMNIPKVQHDFYLSQLRGDNGTSTPRMINMPNVQSWNYLPKPHGGIGTPTPQMTNVLGCQSKNHMSKPHGASAPQMTNVLGCQSKNYLSKPHGAPTSRVINMPSFQPENYLPKPRGVCGNLAPRERNVPNFKSESYLPNPHDGRCTPPPQMTSIPVCESSHSSKLSLEDAPVRRRDMLIEPAVHKNYHALRQSGNLVNNSSDDSLETSALVTSMLQLSKEENLQCSTKNYLSAVRVDANTKTTEQKLQAWPQNFRSHESSESLVPNCHLELNNLHSKDVSGRDGSCLDTTTTHTNVLRKNSTRSGFKDQTQSSGTDESPGSLVSNYHPASNNLGLKDVPSKTDSCSDATMAEEKFTRYDPPHQCVAKVSQSFAAVKAHEARTQMQKTESSIHGPKHFVSPSNDASPATESGQQTLPATRKTVLTGHDVSTESSVSNDKRRGTLHGEPCAVNSAPPSTGRVAVTADLEKARHQLILLLHANQCRKVSAANDEVRDCDFPGCQGMKDILVHTTTCHNRRDCPFPQCSSSRQLLLHYHSCIRHDCTVCVAVKQAPKQGDVAALKIQSNVQEASPSSNDCYESRQNVLPTQQRPDIRHVNDVSLPKRKERSSDELCLALMPTLRKLYRKCRDPLSFKQQTDSSQINLVDIKRKLREGLYEDAWDFVDDIWLMFDNAWHQNRTASRTYRNCTRLAEIFRKQIDPVMRSLGYCCGQKYFFEPRVLSCYGKPQCTIPRNSKYWVCAESNRAYCQECFTQIAGVPFKKHITTITIRNQEFAQITNDRTVQEKFIKCQECGKKFHQICVLHYDPIWPNGFVCSRCLNDIGLKREKNNFTARQLQKTELGSHIEHRVNTFLKNKGCISHKVIVRVVSNTDKFCYVQPGLRRSVDIGEWPESFPYRAKTLLAFQKIGGIETCFFGMYVQEYGSECAKPNTRRVYIAFLDSVHFFRPKELRTDVYHEIVLGYMEYTKKLGYRLAHIWSSPPAEGEDHIFHCHPVEQKIPTSKRLHEWYKKMLAKGIAEGSVIEYKNIVEQATDDNITGVAELPYFAGDFWPSFLEESINMLEQQRKKRKFGSSDESATSEADEGIEERLRKGEQYATSNVGWRGRSNRRSGIPNCAYDLWGKVCSTMELYKDSFFVVHLNSSEDVASFPPIDDPDLPFKSGFMDDRYEFLTLAREKRYEFSSLRRASYSTMAILHELHKRV